MARGIGKTVIGTAIQKRHVRAALGKTDRDPLPDAAAGAGYNRNLAAEIK
jgi:hypothetical protein